MRLLHLLPLALLLAACGEPATLPPPLSPPIEGEWSMSREVVGRVPGEDRAEWRLTYRADGTYTSQTLAFDDDAADPLVYRHQATGEYRLAGGAVSSTVRTWRWWTAPRGTWQDEFVAQPDAYGPPIRYTVQGDRLVLHFGPSQDEHGLRIPARDLVLTRR